MPHPLIEKEERSTPRTGLMIPVIRRLSLTLAAAVALVSLPVQTASADDVFAVHCEPSHQLADDPIVFPGQPGASHLHQFWGSRTTFAGSTYGPMTMSATSCELTADRAGYWIPVLLSPLGVPAPVLRINNYYRSSGVQVRAFPPNLRIITGGDTLNPTQGGPGGVNVSYSCMRTGPFVPIPGNCTGVSNKLIAHVRFPNCLREGATDSIDHRSHMIYAARCPPGYVHVPKLTIHVQYAVVDARGYYLSSDAMAGFTNGRSLHADFWNTWNQTVLQKLVTECLNGSRGPAFCIGMTDAKLAKL